MVNKLGDSDNFNHIYNDKNEKLEIIGDIILNLEYWDCDCDENYIHHISDNECKKCKSTQEEHPNSRECEVMDYFNSEKT